MLEATLSGIDLLVGSGEAAFSKSSQLCLHLH